MKIMLQNNYQSKQIMRDYTNEKYILTKFNQVLQAIQATNPSSRKYRLLNKRAKKTESLLSIQINKDSSTTRETHSATPLDLIGEDEKKPSHNDTKTKARQC